MVASPVGEMTLVSPAARFELLVPAHWIQNEPGAQSGLVFTAIDPDERGALLILIEEPSGTLPDGCRHRLQGMAR